MKQLLIAAAVVLLAACSDPGDPPAPVAVPPAPAATAAGHQATPFDSLLKSEDKARNVENVLQKADQNRREAIKNAGG